MEIAQIFINVFGEYPSIETVKLSKTKIQSCSFERHLKCLHAWLNDKLTRISSHAENDSKQLQQQQDGKIGPPITVFDYVDDRNLMNVSSDNLTIQSQSAFSTIKANCCVFKGKWMYEVQLRSKGVMQIGWCSAKCKFTQDTGVGDTKYSYGLDGSKQRLWHVHTKKYGPYWRSGDILGVCLDMDNGRLEYYRNGIALGEAFNDIERGPGIALFPAMSLAYNDCLTANFGGSPFRHPVSNYLPLQVYPESIVDRAEFLLQHLINLSRIISTYKQKNQLQSTLVKLDKVQQQQQQPSTEAVHMILAGILIDKLASFLSNSYVIEDKIFSFIRSICVIRSGTDSNEVVYPGMPSSTLGTFLTLLWTYMEPEDVQIFLKKLVNFLSSMYREIPVDLEYEKQRIVIVILTCICNHPMSRKYLLEFKFFKRNCLPIFLYIKPPDETTLGDLLPNDRIWTVGLGGPKDVYLNACSKLSKCTEVLYTLQKNLVEKLIDNSDGDDCTSSSRKIFTHKLRRYVMENSLEHRAFFFLQGTYTSPTQPAIALSFLCILLDTIQNAFKTECNTLKAYVNPTNFYDGSLKYYHFDRIGGIESHLKKVYRAELISALGSNHSIIAHNDAQALMPTDLNDIYSAMFLITGNTSAIFSINGQGTSSRIERRLNELHVQISAGNIDSYKSLNCMLDSCILYYYAVAHKYIVLIADLRDNIGILSDILIETKNSCANLRRTIEHLRSYTPLTVEQDNILKDLHERFGERNSVFAQRSMELARKQAWYRSVALGERRKDLLHWMLETIFETLKDASGEGGLFTFVPEVYVNILPILLDTILDFSFHDLAIQNDLRNSQNLVLSAAEFLTSHSVDTRILLASCKDALLQALGALTCHECGIRSLEQISMSSQLALVNSLVRPYENRAWGQSNWLLLRFWLGEGFGYRDTRPPCIWQGGNETSIIGLLRSRGKNGSHTGLLHHIAPACPSKHYQDLICQILTNDETLCTTLINSILSQLNWAFSEFVLMLQEFQNVAQRNEQQILSIEPRQLKICSMCYELTVSLLRALEMLVSIAPFTFKDPTRPNSDLLLSQICQLISQVLSRVTIPPGCFQYVIDLCLPDMGVVTHFGIITATLGILLALLKDELVQDEESPIATIPRITKCLLTEPSFQIACLEFCLGEVKTPILVAHDLPRGNFDPQARDYIDPLTNEVRTTPMHEIRTNPPIIKFCLSDYASHISKSELDQVYNMIEILLIRQTLLSDVTLPSEDSLCPICYSKSISAKFEPCQHQSCANCIAQHLMNTKVCFYCKTYITKVVKFDGTVIFEATLALPAPPGPTSDTEYAFPPY